MNNLLKNKKRGNAWAGILILLTFILTLGLAVMSDSLSTTLQTRKLAQIHVAQALCDAGVERAIWELNTTSNLLETSFTLPTGDVKVSIANGSPSSLGWVEIQATSYVPNEENPKTTRTVRAKIKNEPNESAIGFDKAVQVGGLGVEVYSGAKINGSVYSGGKVWCHHNGIINGDIYVHDNDTDLFTNSIVDGCKNGIKDVFSHDILNTTVGGIGYYVGSKIGSTGIFQPIDKEDLPGYEELPIPEAEIQRFKSWAAKDGEPYEGPFTVGNEVKIIGPKVINGDLRVATGGTLILTGALQVIGDIIISSNSNIILDESFERNGSILMASKDTSGNKGKIDIGSGVTIKGTGFEEEQCDEEGNCTTRKPSYILIIAESDSDNEASPAIWAGNNSGSVIYYAPNGIIRLRPNTAIHAITGAGLIMDNNSSLNFSDGLELGNFSGGPGRTWRLIEWQVLYPGA